MNARLSNRLYHLLQRLRGEPVQAALADVFALEPLGRSELRALQATRLRGLLLYAARHVPYYRQHLSPLLPEIEEARSHDELKNVMARVPPLAKGYVVGREAEFTSDEVKAIPTHQNTTSGSTGTPLVFPCDQASWAYRHALLIRSFRWFGVEIGEPYGYFFGLHWHKMSRLTLLVRDFVLNRVRVSAYAIAPETVREHFTKLSAHGVTHFVGYPSAIYDFCVLAANEGIRLDRLRLKSVFTTAEPLLPFQRRLIEEATGAGCVNMYGSVEGGFNACECPSGRIHATIESTWFQRDEASGEILVTDFFLKAFPLINFMIGDEIEFAEDGETCPCGKKHPLIERIVGRSGEPIHLPNGRVVNANLPSYIFKPLAALRCIRRYRFVQTRAGDLILQLVVTERFEQDHLRIIEKETERAFGAGIPLQVRILDALPVLPNAKHRCYVRLDGPGSEAVL